MNTYSLRTMKKGWFIGDFAPVAFRTQDCEVAVKHYRAGEVEAAHYHRIAREITVIVSGTVQMNGRTFDAGDIVALDPGEVATFCAISDCVTTVVKIPSVPDDKYVV